MWMASKSFGRGSEIENHAYFHVKRATNLEQGHVLCRVESDDVLGQQRQGNVGLGITEPAVPREVVVAPADTRASI